MNMAQAVSRRTFLSGVFTVGAVAAAGLMLPACVSSSGEGAEAGTKAGTQPSSPPASTAANRTPPSRSYPTRDYSADVIIIGGGLAGMMAARNALAQGASVILVDKGPFGRSGATGINWGHEVMSYEGASSETLGLALAPMTMAGLVDQEYYSAIIHASYEMCVLQQAVKSGAVLEMTAVPEDSPHNMKYPFLRTAEPVMPRFFAQQLRNSSVQIIDRTMVLDILQDEAGAASGIVALDLVTGEGVTVTAKAVVMCTGSPCWANGWSGVGAKTNASPENTGDGLAILLGHGVPIKNIEQWDLYFYNSSPSGIAFSQGIGVSVGDHPENMLNSDGKNFLVDNPDFTSVDRPVYELLCMKEVYEGRGSSKGGLWYDITRLEEPDYVMAFNRRVPENHRRALRYVDENPCEIIPTPWECAGAPHLDKKGQTQIEGLFFASAGDQAYGGSCATVCLAGGHLAGGSAAALAAEREMPVLDAATAQAVLDGAFSALENDPPQPVRATKVMHTIQNIMNQYVWMGRTDVGLNRAVVELNRVRDELMPRMVVVDKSKTFNQEWRQAIEVPFMWANVMATAQSALARTESRGSHHRLDHPATDNSRWLKNVYVRVDDGQWSTEARGIVTELVPAPLVAVTTSEPSLV
jgi:succinate dehydrogenase / fumarate reductase flavoprotein subunit